MISQYRKLLQNVGSIILISRTVNDDFHSSQLAAHGCVLLSGAIESVVREVIPAFSKSKSHPGVANYVKISLGGFTNPRPDKLFNLLSQFDPDFEQNLEKMRMSEMRDHIASIVSNRHLIAHGRNTGITPNRLDDWRKSTEKFCGFIEQNFSV